MSLKETLKQTINLQGVVTTDEVEKIAKLNYKKMSNAERRLRELAREGVIKMRRNEKGAIVGYMKFDNTLF